MGIDKASLKQFKHDVQRFVDETENDFNNRKKKLALDIFRILLGYSPFKTGSYILSHKASIGAPVFHFEVVEPRTISREQAESRSLQQAMATISRATPKDSIYITQSIPYAINVEVIGWYHGAVPPYMTYTTASEFLRFQIKKIMHGKRTMKI